MSCYFQSGDHDVWNPSNAVARIFVEQAETLSRLVDHDSGLGPIVEDECEIDARRFVEFTDLLVQRYQSTNNPVLRSLIEGFIAVALVITRRLGAAVSSIESQYADHWERLRTSQERHMPTG